MSKYQPFVILLVVACMSVIGLTSCGNDQPVSVSIASVQPVQMDTKENDKRFLVRAVELKYDQILISKLAGQRAATEEIKSLARMLEDANRNERSAIASLAILKSIPVPSVPTQSAQAAYDTLNLATIEEFDQAYLSMVIEGYDETIRHFESAGSTNLDPDISKKIQSMIPGLREHQMKASGMRSMMNPVSEVIEE
jgi:putative membrane protein